VAPESRVRRAAVVAVGDELLAGATADSNSAWLARALSPLGLTVTGIEVVGDDESGLVEALQRALERAELVLTTGGLGPTLDDNTRHGIAAALGLELGEDPEALAEVEAWFRRRGIPMGATNRRQALLPRGAHVLRNTAGTAPGFRVAHEGRWLLALPGPPRELAVVWEESVRPWLEQAGLSGEPLPEQRFFLFGVPESRFAERVGPWMARDADPLIGCTVREGVLTATLRARAGTADSRARLAARAAEFRTRFAGDVFSEDEWALEAVLVRALVARGISLTVAESCTGGAVAALITGVPGASTVFREGFVTYSNEAKQERLGVAAETLAAHGAVSAATVSAMALGAAHTARARLAVAVSGIAGPDGGTSERPIGLVWFGTALDGETETVERRFPPAGRDAIRRWAARSALFLAWRRLRDAGLLEPAAGGR
jgi:nicotinamide-nucleotide amidase